VTIFQHKDGELRIYEHGCGGVTRYIEILFTDANLSGPIARSRTDERLILMRGVLDPDAYYAEGGDAPVVGPYPLTFSCKTADTWPTMALDDLLSGTTIVYGYRMYSRKGKGISIPGFTTEIIYLTDESGNYITDEGGNRLIVYLRNSSQVR